jgi:type I restriction enzyme S subunit
MNIYDYRFEDDGLAYINDEQAYSLSAVTVEPLDILLNITGASVGRCCIVPTRHLPARVNQHVMIVRVNPNACGPHYVLHTINSHGKKQALLNIARAGGATREALTKDVVQNTAFTIPPPHLIGQFEAIVGKFFEQGEILGAQNSQLTKARDLLLPRLMNGEIPV